MATAATKSSYNRQYDLDSNSRRNKERDTETGEMKENPWHQHCKKYAAQQNISYAAAISLAGPSWKAHKEKMGITYRNRSKTPKKEGGGGEGGGMENGKRPLPLSKKRVPKEKKERKEGKRPREEDDDRDDRRSGGRDRDHYERERRPQRYEPYDDDSRHPTSSRERAPPPQKRRRGPPPKEKVYRDYDQGDYCNSSEDDDNDYHKRNPTYYK